MPNSKNVEILKELNEKVSKAKSIVFSDFKGVNSKDLTAFREEIREKGGEVVVSKNTLLKLALKENNTPDEANNALEGQTVAILSYQDPLATIKSFFNFSTKVEKLKAKAGVFENKYLSEMELDALSKLPSKQELIGKLVGSMKSPIFGLVNTLNQTQSKVVYIFKAIADKKSN
jgi:large subunit ribosomal protein L10